MLKKILKIHYGDAIVPKRDAAPTVEPLEPRVLYSADIPGIGDSEYTADRAWDDHNLSALGADQTAVVSSIELVVVDSGVAGNAELLDDLAQQIERGRLLQVLQIDAHDDGISVVTDALKLRNNVAALHIISHGSASGMALGADWIDDSTFSLYQNKLAEWAHALNKDADILLYGCDLASSEDGQLLMRAIANTTQADVAASADDTGHQLLGGDWEFEFSSGSIANDAVFSNELQTEWEYLLGSLVAVPDDLGDVPTNTEIPLDGNILANDQQNSSPFIRLVGVAGASSGEIARDVDDLSFSYSPAMDVFGSAQLEYTIASTADPILAHYPLTDDAIYDATGNAQPVITSTDVVPAFDGTTESFSFDGDDDYIQFDDVDYSNEFTLSFDFKPGFSLQRENLFQHGESAASNTVQFWIEGDWLTINVADNSDTGALQDTTVNYDISGLADSWHNLTLSHQQAVGFTVYIDGVDIDVFNGNPQGGGDIDPPGAITIGSKVEAGSFSYPLENHRIKDIRVYNEIVDPVAIATGSIDYSSSIIDMIVVASNQPAAMENSGSAVNYTEDGSAVVLDADIQVVDPEHFTADNYAGATVTLERVGGRSVEDVFEASGALGGLDTGDLVEYNDLLIGVVQIGDVIENEDGKLTIQFSSNATQDLVNKSLQAIAYKNSSENPPSAVQIQWTFSDGYTGDIGSEEIVTAVSTVNITPLYDITMILPSLVEVIEDIPSVIGDGISIAHDGASSEQVSVELSVLVGQLSVPSDPAVMGSSTGDSLFLKSTVDNINTVLKELSYVANQHVNGSDTMHASVSINGEALSDDTVNINIAAVNDAPVIDNAIGTVLFDMSAGVPVVIDPDISLSDVELEAVDSFTGVTLTLTRIDSSGYAPSPQYISNPYDVFSSASQLNLLAPGSDLDDGGGKFGVVTQNADGLLLLSFDENADRDRVVSLMRSIAYENTSDWPPTQDSWPHKEVTLQWALNDNGWLEDGSTDPVVQLTGTTVSYIDISASGSQPIDLSSNEMAFRAGTSDQLLDRRYINTIDLDSPDSAIEYEITDMTPSVVIMLNGAPLSVGAGFTQEDVSQGRMTANSTSAAPIVEQVRYDVIHNGVGTGQSHTLQITVLDDGPTSFQSGVTLNKNGENDAYLGDISGYKFVDYEPEITWEFLFSQLTVNENNEESTFYSAASGTGHYEHLIVRPDLNTTNPYDGILEWDIKSINPSVGVPFVASTVTIDDIYDGDIHQVALTLDLDTFVAELFYDGTRVGSFDDSGSGGYARGGFPWLIGQQLAPNSSFGFDNYRFVQGKHFSGTLHEFRLWDVVKTGTELDQSRFARFDNDPYPAGLTVNWHMNDLSGDSTVAAISDNTNSGDSEHDPGLAVGYASESRTPAGFIKSIPEDELFISENAPNTSVVGYVTVQDPVPDSAGYRYEIVDTGEGVSPFTIDRNSGRISVADNSLISDGTSQLELTIRVFSTEVQAASFTDTIKINVRSINEAPVLDPGGNPVVNITEGDPPVVLNREVSVSDDELAAASYQGSTLTVERLDPTTNLAAGQAQDQYSIHPSYSGTGLYTIENSQSKLVIRFSAGADQAAVASVLRAISYENTSADPEPSFKLQWTFSDENAQGTQGEGGVLQHSFNSEVNIAPVNNAPILSTLSNPVYRTVDEDTSLSIDFSDLYPSAFDVDGSVVRFTLTAATNTTLVLNAGDEVVWTPLANQTGLVKAFDVVAVDNESKLSIPVPIFVQILPHSDPPEGRDNANLRTTEESEIKLRMDDFGFNDVDGDNFDSVKVTGVTYGKLQLSGADLISDTVDISEIEDENLTFLPNTDVFDVTAEISFHVIDSGTNHTDPVANTLSIFIEPVNDPPVGQNHHMMVVEDGELSFSLVDFPLDDSRDASALAPDGNPLYRVIFETLPENGSLLLDGVPLQPNSSILFSDIATLFKFQPFANETNDGYLEFRLRDSGGVENGGGDISVEKYRIDLEVDEVNDAPSAADGYINVLEGEEHTFSVADFRFSDVADSHNLSTVTIHSMPEVGELLLNDSALSSDDVNAADIALDKLKYIPPESTEGDIETQLTFSVTDDGGTTNGVNTSLPVINTITINNQGVNHAPVINENLSVTTPEDNSYTFKPEDFAFTDNEDHELQAVRLEILPEKGILKLGNTEITGSVDVDVTEIEDEFLVYTPFANLVGPDELTFRVRDSGGVQNGGDDTSVLAKTLVIDVLPVDDPLLLSGIETEAMVYNENTGTMTVTNSLSLENVDNVLVHSATVQIVYGYMLGEDFLQLPHHTEIDGDFDPATGVLALTGLASTTTYEQAIQSVQFINSSENPSTNTRTLYFRAHTDTLNSNELTRDILIQSVNDLPVLSNTEPFEPNEYAEDNEGLLLFSDLLVVDVDSPVESAQVVLNNAVAGEDSFSFETQAGITGEYNYNANTSEGTLSLSGAATATEYQEVLRSVAYINLSDNPSVLDKTVTVTVSDILGQSNVVTQAVSISLSNDAPVLSTSVTDPLGYVENAVLVIGESISIRDPDHQFINSARVSLLNAVNGEDQLSFTEQEIISGSYNSMTGELNFIGSATVTEYESILRSVAYKNLSDNPSGAERIVEFVVSDGDLTSNVLSRTISIAVVNDPPVLSISSTSGEGEFLSYPENSQALPVISSLVIEDTDHSSIDSALVALDNFNPVEDRISYDEQPNILADYNPTIGELRFIGTAPVSEYEDILRSVRFENLSDDPSDSPRTARFTVSDGSLDSNELSRAINPVAANDAPQLSISMLAGEGEALWYPENSPPLPVFGSIVIDDSDHTFLNSAVVTLDNFVANEDQLLFTNQPNINGNFHDGKLIFDGLAPVAAYESVLRSVSYENVSQNPTVNAQAAPRAIQVIVSDGDLNSNVLSRPVNVSPINDAPSAFLLSMPDSQPLVYTDNTAPTSLFSSLKIEDPDSGAIDSARVVLVNSVSSEDRLSIADQLASQMGISGQYDVLTGELNLYGSADLGDYEALLQSIRYENIVETPNPSTRIVQLVVNDGTLDSNMLSRTINVSPVDHSLRTVDDEFSVEESSIFEENYLTNDHFTEGDSLISKILQPPAHGKVTLLTGGNFNYVHNGSDTTSDVFTYELTNGDVTDTAVVYVTINPVNDPPVAQVLPVVETTVNQSLVIVLPDDVFTDSEDQNNLTVELVAKADTDRPEWLFYDAESRTLNGVPPHEGVYIAKLVATDSEGAQAETDLIVNVLAIAEEPTNRSSEESTEKPELGAAVAINSSLEGVDAKTGALPENVEPTWLPGINLTNEPEIDYELDLALQENTGSLQHGVVSLPEVTLQTSVLETIRAWSLDAKHSESFAVVQNAEVNIVVLDQVASLEQLLLNDTDRLADGKLSEMLDAATLPVADQKSWLNATTGAVLISGSLTVGYIIWLVRGGLLLSSALASLPAWRLIDPLPVLETVDSADESRDGDESLDELVTRNENNTSSSDRSAEKYSDEKLPD